MQDDDKILGVKSKSTPVRFETVPYVRQPSSLLDKEGSPLELQTVRVRVGTVAAAKEREGKENMNLYEKEWKASKRFNDAVTDFISDHGPYGCAQTPFEKAIYENGIREASLFVLQQFSIYRSALFLAIQEEKGA